MVGSYLVGDSALHSTEFWNKTEDRSKGNPTADTAVTNKVAFTLASGRNKKTNHTICFFCSLTIWEEVI